MTDTTTIDDVITAHELRFERVLDAPPETVWAYLTDPELRARWFMGGPIEPHPGGKIYMTFDHDRLSDGNAPMPERYAVNKGKRWFETIEVYDPPRRLSYSWDNGAQGNVTFELAPVGDGKTRLSLVHSGIQDVGGARNFTGGWHAHLAALGKRLAGEPVENFWALHAAAETMAREKLG